MKRIKWVFAVLATLVAVVPSGCDSGDEQASTQIVATVGRVESGYAFDRANTDLQQLRQIIVPDTADVRPDSKGTDILIYMQKTLDYKGDVPEPMSIRSLRRRMGVAARMDQGTLLLATFGEWDAGGDGGAVIKLVILVPPDVEVIRRPGLSGQASQANAESGTGRSGVPDQKGPVMAKGWVALRERFDPQRLVLQ